MKIEQEKKNQRIGLFISLGIHALLLLVFVFVMAWTEPDPPIPEYGIEMNFGMVDKGSGREQPKQLAEVVKTSQEEAKPEPEPVPTQPVEQVAEEAQTAANSPTPSQQSAEVEDPNAVVEKTKAKPASKSETKKKADKKSKTKEEVKTKKTTESKSSGQKQSGKKSAAQGQGNTNKAGDQGKKDGKIDSRALMGDSGSKNGFSLDMTGWSLESPPSVNENSSETGKIVFEIKVDEYGDIVSVKTKEKTVSAGVERVYRQAVESLVFVQSADNLNPPPMSVGEITFIIKSR